MIKNANVSENQLMLPTGKIITFNNEQFDGVKSINTWLRNKRDNKNFFTLAGFAGTGKTSIIKKVLDGYRGGIVVSAPTHKAKKVVMRTTNRDGQTMQALLGLRPDVNLDDFDPNRPQFNPIATPRINDYNFVVIDEASMINEGLFNLIKELMRGSTTKLLFMGDPAQIPPIGEAISTVFLEENIDLFHQLTKVERQTNDNPLFFVYDLLRNNLTRFDGGFKRTSNINNNGDGVNFLIDRLDFRNRVLEKYSSHEYRNNIDFCKLIVWRNDTVMKANHIIRSELLNKTSDIIEVNDILMGYRTVTSANIGYNIIENSADYKVVDKSELMTNEYGITGYLVNLEEEIDVNKKINETVFIVDANNPQNLSIYGQLHDFYRETSRENKKNWKKYYEFRRNNLLMKNIDRYADGTLRDEDDIIVKDLDYGYAITGHKSQGSTYDHVFVMENDIYANPLLKERNQILYVALTRPMHTATVLTTKIDE